MRIAAWNLERKKLTSGRGAEAVDYLETLSAEIVVVVEGRTSFALPGGTTHWGDPPRGERFDADERTVVVSARCGVERLEIDMPIDQRRFVPLRAATSIGSLVVLAICIPWHMAEVTYHHGPKKKPWEEHLEYLVHLKAIMDSLDEPFIVAGDFNQRVPRVKYGNRQAAEALEETFEGLEIVSSGVVAGCARPGIDHIALSPQLRSVNVQGWPNDVTGNRLSDHDGVLADVEFIDAHG